MNNTIHDVLLQDYPLLFSGLPAISSENEKELVQFCEKHKEHVLSAMPWAASEIAGTCGFKSLFQLISHHGGRKIYIPKDASKFYKLYEVEIPKKQYSRLCKYADSAGNIEMPSAWGVFVAIRRAAMQIAMQDQVSPKYLVKTFGVTMRSIRLIKSRNTYM
ncbi:hypothetical protein SAMN05192562_10783 [Kosakonia arachidis]|uniref:Mor transcription activator family protein n=1 Tax=Kosakonia arachidis TaxID=551989 RepID=A0A1I7DW75_9ENTR|nr:hypothetical protein [Kosakonia arachidis]SFU15930.1 hypothetical protein SAMN05192562_10783 [Kosakonia arachidis]